MSEFRRTIYVDCTETVTSCINTGIQRNVVNILQRSEILKDRFYIDVIPVVSLNGKFYKYNSVSCRKRCAGLLSRVFNYCRNLVDQIFEKKPKTACPGINDKSLSTSTSSHSSIIETCRNIMPFLYFIAHLLDRSLLEYHPITVRENDIIFFADSFWNTETRKSFSTYADSCNILLLYDIIPIVKPEVCDDMHVNTFRTNFTGVLKHLDGIITISGSEKDAVQCYLDTDRLNGNNIPLDYYYLGGDFAPGQQGHLQVRHAIDHAMSSENTFLMVGTIEPRKNHAFVLDAFEELWRRGENVSLCIVGKPGWKCSGFLQRIKSHECLGKSLFYIHDANDHELSHCYDQCKAVVFASVAEGFGLPLVEAMSYGRNVLASDIPVFREIGGNYPIYFPHDDVNALVCCIHDYTRGTFEKRQPRSWISWDESVIDLFGKLLKMADGSKQSRDKNSVLQ